MLQDYKNLSLNKAWKEKFWSWPIWNQDHWLVLIQTVWLSVLQHQTTLKFNCWFLTDKLVKEFIWKDMKVCSLRVTFYLFWIQREKLYKNVLNTSKLMFKDLLSGKVSDWELKMVSLKQPPLTTGMLDDLKFNFKSFKR